MTIKINHAVIVLTGARGTGKTTLAATFLPPSRLGEVYYHDTENSANSFRSQIAESGLDFGRYVDLAGRFKNIDGDDLLKRINSGHLPWVDASGKNALVGMYEYILSDLNTNLTQDKYKVYVMDSLEKFEAAMAAYVEANKKSTGWTISAFGKMWNDAYFPLYENFLSALFARGVEVVIMTSHLRNVWEGSRQIIGKVEPSGKRLLYRLSTLMLWLLNDRDNADGAPAALVLKERLGQIEIEADTWNISRRLPERLPRATWADIRKYLESGVDLAYPKAGEVMSNGERSMISELLSDAQMQLMILEAQKETAEASIMPASNGATFALPQSSPVADEDMNRLAQRETALRLIGAGKSKSEVASELSLTLPEVIRLLK